MKLIRNPSFWSCLPASVAMVLDIDIKELIRLIGHDGGEIIFPDLPSPGKYRGFHLSEVIPIALSMSFAVTPIDARPCSTPDGEHDFEVHFTDSPEKRIQFQMFCNPGILTGKMRKWNHAVAWDGYQIYDPIGKVYPFNKIIMEIETFYRFDKIKSS